MLYFISLNLLPLTSPGGTIVSRCQTCTLSSCTNSPFSFKFFSKVNFFSHLRFPVLRLGVFAILSQLLLPLTLLLSLAPIQTRTFRGGQWFPASASTILLSCSPRDIACKPRNSTFLETTSGLVGREGRRNGGFAFHHSVGTLFMFSLSQKSRCPPLHGFHSLPVSL